MVPITIFQTDGLTGTNVIQNGTGYTRDIFRDMTGRLGGPIVKDKMWFYGSFQYTKDASKQPGVAESVVQSRMKATTSTSGSRPG